jgi:hypothetical protein
VPGRGKAGITGSSCLIEASVLLDGVLDCGVSELDKLVSQLVENCGVIGNGEEIICRCDDS